MSILVVIDQCLTLGNCLQQALRKIGKENIVHNCVFNIEWVTDAAEKELAKVRLNSRGSSVDGLTVTGRRVSAMISFLPIANPNQSSWMKVLKVMKNTNVVDM